MDERALIARLAPFAAPASHGLGDDCAWLPQGEGRWLVVSSDSSVAGVHFPPAVRGAAASERAVRTAASDLAAKGATPIGMLSSLHLPHSMESIWVEAVALGVADAAQALRLPLLGGDTVRHGGPLAISVTVLGEVERAAPLLRSGARPGDGVWASGPIGEGAFGLRYLQGDPGLPDPTGDDLLRWEEKFLRPEPRFDLRAGLGAATASLDISDGLVADARRLAEASGVGLAVEAAAVPLTDTSRRWVGGDPGRWTALATAGDDYELLVTFPAGHSPHGWTRIGEVVPGEGAQFLWQGAPLSIASGGWEH